MRCLLSLLCVLLISVAAHAALQFPSLTARVTDDAHILSPAAIEGLDRLLADQEKQTTDQVVVVTLRSLQGSSIEDYGYQLGRAWGIGQKDKDNGVLLLVAPKEHKVRIEVGYGLEGVLTDAVSSTIIQSIILPSFRSGNMEQGVVAGTKAIVVALGGQLDATSTALEGPATNAAQAPVKIDFNFVLSVIIIIVFFILFILSSFSRGGLGSGLFGFAAGALFSQGRFGGGGFGGGGFGGGGGGFGGGGASGSW